MEDIIEQKQFNMQKILLFLAGALIISILLAIKHFNNRPKLPHLYELHSYSLLNQDNIQFGSNNLKHKWYVANFVFTSCPMSCPKIMQTMSELQTIIKNEKLKLNLVTFSVDPEIDTPNILKKYSLEYKADNKMWTFLTGELYAVKHLLMNDFKVVMGEKDITDLMAIAHSNKLVLVDGNGIVRSYYSAEIKDLKNLINDYKTNF